MKILSRLKILSGMYPLSFVERRENLGKDNFWFKGDSYILVENPAKGKYAVGHIRNGKVLIDDFLWKNTPEYAIDSWFDALRGYVKEGIVDCDFVANYYKNFDFADSKYTKYFKHKFYELFNRCVG